MPFRINRKKLLSNYFSSVPGTEIGDLVVEIQWVWHLPQRTCLPGVACRSKLYNTGSSGRSCFRPPCLLEVWPWRSNTRLTWDLVKNVEAHTLSQTSTQMLRSCILTSSLGDLHAHYSLRSPGSAPKGARLRVMTWLKVTFLRRWRVTKLKKESALSQPRNRRALWSKEASCIKEEPAKGVSFFWELKYFGVMEQRLSKVAVISWRQESWAGGVVGCVLTEECSSVARQPVSQF